MRALFFTTQTSDCGNHVRAWESAFGPAKHVAFNHRGVRNDWQLAEACDAYKPQVIFYIGAHEAPGNPTAGTLKAARAFAPTVNLCSDAADHPWHPVLHNLRNQGCFDLQVGIDGGMSAPVDLVTLTPVDPRPFEMPVPPRDIRCGFSGSVGNCSPRAEIVKALAWFGGLTVRDRSKQEGYPDHARFMKRCRMVLNVSRTGTGRGHHVKGRVLEAGWAGNCLLESEGSPIGQWFPEDCFLIYRDPKEAAAMIRDLDDETLERTAARLAGHVRAHFSPARIYGDILGRLGLVSAPEPVQAA